MCMFVVVWQFEIAEEKVAAFEAAYGPDGSWANSSAPRPITAAQSSSATPTSPAPTSPSTAGPAKTPSAPSAAITTPNTRPLDRSCDALTSRETRIGAYTV